ncbi:HEAT repeat domain-containing protein [Coleofasciculus sp. FACHB-SPT9]|uniref:HEAT repeat domain-containing protein n=1 Tax=Cyanophyceae TaxID=3028117 RepID=UPI0016826A61|nr:HEAT repeat domain-containing protein [Coleofasciculus sp. FACHB-SPT9]MBD1890589.1 HEAT repeat domain-containing protein [Coleofasciculus sp. FACHB-SPT9]
MAEIRNRNSVQVNEAGKQKLIEAKAAKHIYRNYKKRIWTYLDIAEASGVGEKTVKRFFAGESVDCDNAIAIATALNLELAELIDPKSDPSPPPPETPIGWRDICHKMLEEQLRRYQFRRQATGTGLGHEVGIYVPLGLVKPTTQPRRSEEFCPSPDEGRLQYQLNEKEIEKRFEADAFLREVIEEGEGKMIAIIGEPGAGKSTWLEQIARHLKDSENVSRLPICIQLGSLDGKTLEEYLLQVWLKEALSLQGMVVSAQMQTELMQLFNSHQVWLLLDGVDEIRADTSTGANSPLQGIANQLRGWVAQTQTLLTCRLNVWQANDRVVPNCDIYRTLDFDDSQVGEFIGEWFARAGKPQLGKQLREKLGESGRERIRDLIRNPLRLALLCQTWAVKQGELPKTKATLYQRFREDFYEWKKNEFPISWQQRQELNAALGRLAVAAIENQTPLRESLAYQVMGESLFELARQIGWLNLVYRDGETDEPVYAFYHLTFQEYFAALAIDNWHFFLTHDNGNPQPLPGNIYRIFEPQWKEVILLWLGREDVEREQKEEFIWALGWFDDGCYCFYQYRAYFLASSGVAEFQDCPWADEIVAQIVTWGFGYFNIDKQEWWTFLDPIAVGARASLLETNCILAINQIVDLLETTESEDTRWMAAYSLGKIDPGNEVAISGLVRLLETTENESTRSSAAQSLGEIGTGNEVAIAGLLRILETTESEDTRRRAARSLGEIGTGNEVAIAGLLRSLETTEDEDTRWTAAYSLGEIGTGNEVAIAGLLRILETTESEDTRSSAASSLGKIDPGNEVAIAGLLRILETTENKDTRSSAAYSLGEIGTGNEVAIAGLLRILETTESEDTRSSAASSLGKIDPGNEVAIAGLLRILETTENKDTRWSAARSLGEIGTGNEVAIAGLLRSLETTEDEDTRRSAARSLGEIGTGNEVAIAGLLRLLETTEDEDTRRRAARSLGEIGTGNEVAIAGLLRLLETTESEDTRWTADYSLREIGTGNEVAIAGLLRILETTESEDTRSSAASNLGKIDPGNEVAIAGLLRILETTESGVTRWSAASSLGKIGTGNEVAIAGLLRILETTESEDTRSNAASSLGRILENYQMPSTVLALQHCLTHEVYKSNFKLYENCYKLIWECAQTLPYPTFYQAWHHPPITPHPEVTETTEVGFTPFTQRHNLAVLPKILHAAINNDPQMRDKVQLICIDSSKFENPDNPASEIYAEMVMQGCPERPNGEPETMQALKVYCQLKCQGIFLIFYEDTSGETPQGFSQTFLTSLSKFHNARRICVVSEQPCNLQTFSPSQPNLVTDIVSWIREKMMEE